MRPGIKSGRAAAETARVMTPLSGSPTRPRAGVGRLVSLRSLTAERGRRERLEFLYDTALALAGDDDTPEMLERVLALTLTRFDAAVASIVLLSPSDGDALRTTVHRDGRATRLEPLPAETAAGLRAALDGTPRTPVRTAELTDPWLAGHLREHGFTNGLIAVLAGERAPAGALMVGGRAAGFGDAEQALLCALAENTRTAFVHERLDRTVWQLRQLQDDLRHQAAHDPLTGLVNRATFTEALAGTLGRDPCEAAVIVIDVNDFKVVNETLGQAGGDELLVAIAGRLHECVRPGDTLARVGSDEFAVLLPGPGAESDAVQIAERIDARLEGRFAVAGGPLAVRVSIGLAVGSGDRTSGEALLRNADLAMHRAQEAPTGGVERFTAELAASREPDCELRRRLREATRRADFKVHYQPIVDLATGTVAAREALVRWQDGPRGPVHPAAFIPVAEEMGVIVDIGRQILRRACVDAEGWRTDGDAEPAVHVNLSPVELRDPGFLAGVEAALGASGLAPHRLALEITERAVLSDPTRAIVVLEQVRDLGVRVALDDFGTGYSSLSHLRWLPLDTLKIGSPFVDDLEQSDSSRPFLRMILELAASLELQVIAEGVETRAQLRALRSLRCGFGQGFYLGSPAACAGPAFPADELELRLG